MPEFYSNFLIANKQSATIIENIKHGCVKESGCVIPQLEETMKQHRRHIWWLMVILDLKVSRDGTFVTTRMGEVIWGKGEKGNSYWPDGCGAGAGLYFQ